MHHFVTEMGTHVYISVTKCCIVACGTGALWDLCSRSIIVWHGLWAMLFSDWALVFTSLCGFDGSWFVSLFRSLWRHNYRSQWRHDVETISASLSLCEENSPLNGTLVWNYDYLFAVSMNMSCWTKSCCRWFETSWRSCDITAMS